ncbi:hypothetical protein [Streptomyces sp. NPDC050528]
MATATCPRTTTRVAKELACRQTVWRASRISEAAPVGLTGFDAAAP